MSAVLKPKRVYPPKPRTGIHIEIAEAMHDHPMSAAAVATALRLPLQAVESSMRSMARRGEIVRLQHKPGEWARYRVRGQA